MAVRRQARRVEPRSAGSEWSWLTPADGAKAAAGAVLFVLLVAAFLVLLLSAGQPL
jgi:hypothetical protein